MIWAAWRTQRAQLLTAVLVTLACLVYLLAVGDHQYAVNTAIDRCTGIKRSSRACEALYNEAAGLHNGQVFGFGLLFVVPIFLGLLLGSGIVSRELQDGTARFAFTQGVTRRRWFVAQLGVATLALLILLGIVTEAAFAWAHDSNNWQARMLPNVFDRIGIVMFGYGLCAFAVALLLGAVIRRQAWTFAGAALAVTAIRFAEQRYLRSDLAPVREIATPAIRDVLYGTGPVGSWVVSLGLARRGSSRLIPFEDSGALRPLFRCWARPRPCALTAQFRNVVVVHTASQFWPIQLAETAVFVAAALVLAGVCLVAVSRLWLEP